MHPTMSTIHQTAARYTRRPLSMTQKCSLLLGGSSLAVIALILLGLGGPSDLLLILTIGIYRVMHERHWGRRIDCNAQTMRDVYWSQRDLEGDLSRLTDAAVQQGYIIQQVLMADPTDVGTGPQHTVN